MTCVKPPWARSCDVQIMATKAISWGREKGGLRGPFSFVSGEAEAPDSVSSLAFGSMGGVSNSPGWTAGESPLGSPGGIAQASRMGTGIIGIGALPDLYQFARLNDSSLLLL